MSKITIITVLLMLFSVAVTGCGMLDLRSDGQPEFRGKMAKSYADSEEWWPDPILPPKDAPNIIIF
ncbi:MAG: hypothetical protein ACYTCV_04370, partial [Planctomycetota bacterium]